MNTEIEVKFFVDKQALEGRLVQQGACLVVPRRLMRRKVFDFPPALREHDLQLRARVRDEGDKITMTLKKTKLPHTIDSVQELELVIDSFEAGTSFLVQSGYEFLSYRENFRTSWELDQAKIDIDEWPGLPAYAEIEAPSIEELKRIAACLGIQEAQFMTCSVDKLYEQKLGISAATLRSIRSLTFETAELKNCK